MKIHIVALLFILMFKNAYGSFDNDMDVEIGLGGLTRAGTNLSGESGDSQGIADETGIRKKIVTEVHDLLSQDYKKNVEDLTCTRRVLRKIANISEISGNALTYIGRGATILAASTSLVKAGYLSNILLFAGATCFAIHFTCIGFAKCSAREEAEREKQLDLLAAKVNIHVVPIIPTIEEDTNN
jgi:hypothetical protein